jgi:hypothetical protein
MRGIRENQHWRSWYYGVIYHIYGGVGRRRRRKKRGKALKRVGG